MTQLLLKPQDKNLGYLQWRPIAYLSPKRDFNNSTFPHVDSLKQDMPYNASISLKNSLIHALYGENYAETLSYVSTVMSYGHPKDGFYTETDYLMW